MAPSRRGSRAVVNIHTGYAGKSLPIHQGRGATPARLLAVVFSKPPTSGPVWMLTGKQAKYIRYAVKPDVEALAISMDPFAQCSRLYDSRPYPLFLLYPAFGTIVAVTLTERIGMAGSGC